MIRQSGVGVRRLLALAVLLVCAFTPAAPAQADGDPGSDVLASQNLYSGQDANLSLAQQAPIERLLSQAAAAHFPVQVAIIGGPSDLGTLRGVWRMPRAYAPFLAEELSGAYDGRLLIVTPNGFGFTWYGHPSADSAAYRTLGTITVHPGAAGLAAATEAAVHSLATAAGVSLGAAPGHANATAAPGTAAAPTAVASTTSAAGAPRILTTAASGGGRSADGRAGDVALIVLLLLGVGLGARALHRRRRLPFQIPAVAGFSVLAVVPIVVLLLIAGHVHDHDSPTQANALAMNPVLSPGSAISGPARDFTLTDEQDKPVSLRSYRGKVVLLAFDDSECTTVCPITTSAMLDAKAMLGKAGQQVALLGVEANPAAIQLEDVQTYTQLHGLTGKWHFLTGTLPQLRTIWKQYGILADVDKHLVDHTPALYVIAPDGRAAEIYHVTQAYSAIGQLGQVVAQEASSLLPSHPRVDSHLSYTPVPEIVPTERVSLPRAGGGRTTLGPDPGPHPSAHLQVFFATWAKQVTPLAGHLSALNAYAAAAGAAQLPPLTAVDEGSVEPSPAALPQFLRTLTTPLTYPVAIDTTGRVADGYEVQGQPWFVLTNASGQIVWYWEVDTQGWPSEASLVAHVRAALAAVPSGPLSLAVARRELAGSPAPLAALHRQASQLIGGDAALNARLKALRGTPIVLNVWQSYCQTCQAEFGLFARASASYGRRVAFLGADVQDNVANARAFLFQHPVSYPSYGVDNNGQLEQSLPVAIVGLPTTIYIDSAGSVVYAKSGQYDSAGTLDEDIATYAH